MDGTTEGTAPTRDGRTLAYREVGTGGPTVVFEAGMGSSGRAWGLVQREVGRRARAVSYDRAGAGTSTPDPAGRDLDRLVDDLADLLDHLDDGPAVLVGHSWGGPVVRTLAARRPELVAGLVLVDQTDERCDLYLSPRALSSQRRFAGMLPALARLGLLRFGVRRLAKGFPPDLLADLLATDTSVDGARLMAHELAGFEADIRSLRADPPALPPVPVTWISGTKKPRTGATVRACLVDAHKASAAAHPDGRHVEAPRSGHYVMWSEPELVVAEVLRLLPS